MIDEPVQRTHPKDDFLGKPRKMGHQQGCAGAELDREIAIRHGVQGVSADGFESEFACDLFTVDRVGCSGKGCCAERQVVDALAAVGKAFGVPTRHLVIGHQMVGK
jgi:hypothetical protein